jgi:hypothetical protein
MDTNDIKCDHNIDPGPRDKRWFDGCEYECRIPDCGLVFYEPLGLMAHIHHRHRMPLVDYQFEFKQVVRGPILTIFSPKKMAFLI